MRLDDGLGTTFDLDISGYQFQRPDQGINSPSLTFSDCNWLMVKGKITMPPPRKSWEFLDPCLNTSELENLADWFIEISGNPLPRMISFLEPNLKLSFSSLPNPSIEVTLSQKSASHWNSSPDFDDFDKLSFPVDCDILEQIAREMYDLTSRFPPRNQLEMP